MNNNPNEPMPPGIEAAPGSSSGSFLAPHFLLPDFSTQHFTGHHDLLHTSERRRDAGVPAI